MSHDYDRRQAATARQVEYAWSLLSKVDWDRSGISKNFRGMREKPDKAFLSKMSTPRLSKLIDVLKSYVASNPHSVVTPQASGATPRQKEYIWEQFQRLGEYDFIVVTGIGRLDLEKRLNSWTSNEASKIISKLKDAEKSRARSQRNQTPGRGATPRQVDYAMNLLRRLGPDGWFDSDWGQGMSMPTRGDLESWSSRDVSALIDSLKREF